MRNESHANREAGFGLLSVLDMSPEPVRVRHEPVLPRAVLELLSPRPGAVVVDATVGLGGHSALLLPRLLPGGRLIAVDRDPDALRASRARLVEFAPQVTFVHDDYRHLPAILERIGLQGADGVLLDLGVSSAQLETAGRGFSFLRDGPLDMRMDPGQGRPASALIETASAGDLAEIFRAFGEERFAERIARRIVAERGAVRIATTRDLAGLVAAAVPRAARHGPRHVAMRVFQALRIAVNDELGALQQVLDALPSLLRPGGRAVCIAFHSLEDRLVKQGFARGAEAGWWSLLTKKPVRPSGEEARRNPRARSAKLRAVERRGPGG